MHSFNRPRIFCFVDWICAWEGNLILIVWKMQGRHTIPSINLDTFEAFFTYPTPTSFYTHVHSLAQTCKYPLVLVTMYYNGVLHPESAAVKCQSTRDAFPGPTFRTMPSVVVCGPTAMNIIISHVRVLHFQVMLWISYRAESVLCWVG